MPTSSLSKAKLDNHKKICKMQGAGGEHWSVGGRQRCWVLSRVPNRLGAKHWTITGRFAYRGVWALIRANPTTFVTPEGLEHAMRRSWLWVLHFDLLIPEMALGHRHPKARRCSRGQ
jgi:hypothetical protein